ncbi:MAG TPA: hypothetical protein VGA69_12340, partial [Nitriliruptorales bacterium]
RTCPNGQGSSPASGRLDAARELTEGPTMLTSGPMQVRVGRGSKAHLFQPRDGANAKMFAIRDGGTAYDHVLCGARGALTRSDGLDPCKTCQEVSDRRP